MVKRWFVLSALCGCLSLRAVWAQAPSAIGYQGVLTDNNGVAAAASASGNTLDQAYDQGGAGAGRTITADAGAVNIAGADGLTVNGNVGIGTTSPGARLDVAGSIKMVDGNQGSGKVLASDTDGLANWQSPFLQNFQVFDASGTWTVPSGITKILVEVWGAGGGGGAAGSPAWGGTGGGGGAYGKGIFSVTPGASFTVTVSTGGTGGALTGGNGGNGGTSSFGALISAGGGTGGSGSAGGPGVGGRAQRLLTSRAGMARSCRSPVLHTVV